MIFPVMCFCALLSAVSGQSGGGTDSEIRSLSHGGLKRTYRIHIPPSIPPSGLPSGKRNKPAPLLLALHGGGGAGKSMQKLAGLNALSDKEGFIAVYPDGVDGHWNDGRGLDYRAHRENIDDVGFIAALIDRLGKDLNVDPGRVYVTGMSNGALFAHRLACEIPEKIAAIAPVEGTLLEA
ncbi:MAG: hypothetical protein L0Z50_35680, partial [Verrucomicrobiales bacterium]|nr:hypothetical protein [Verrucomicrobiales bacterium]